jgi:RNA-directed DNA polymerase
MDLEKFFDRVNHDILMSRVAKEIVDVRVLRLVRRYLQAGMMANGIDEVRKEGRPQGGPISPRLSNILLTDLDRELEKGKLAYCRYADDGNIYVSSERAGKRILASLKKNLSRRLKLTVNDAKSGVDRPWKRKFLGDSLWPQPQPQPQPQPRLRVAVESIERLRGRVKEICLRGRGQSIETVIGHLNPVLRGWMNYFRYTSSKRPLDELDVWVRRRLRNIIWRPWKCPRARESRMRRQGLEADRAWKCSVNGRGAWWNSGAKHMIAAMPPKYFTQMGLVSWVSTHQHLQSVT